MILGGSMKHTLKLKINGVIYIELLTKKELQLISGSLKREIRNQLKSF